MGARGNPPPYFQVPASTQGCGHSGWRLQQVPSHGEKQQSLHSILRHSWQGVPQWGCSAWHHHWGNRAMLQSDPSRAQLPCALHFGSGPRAMPYIGHTLHSAHVSLGSWHGRSVSETESWETSKQITAWHKREEGSTPFRPNLQISEKRQYSQGNSPRWFR